MTNVAVAQYAGLLKRFRATIIDGVLTGIVVLVIENIIGNIVGDSLVDLGFSIYINVGIILTELFFVSVCISWLYFALMESSSKQATLGKMVIGIIVTDVEGNRVSFGRATCRHFAKIISTLILFIGYIMIAFTEKKQGLHDMIAETLVIMKR